MSDKIKELRAHTARLIDQATVLREINRLLREEAVQIKAELANNKAELNSAQEIISALLAKYNKS